MAALFESTTSGSLFFDSAASGAYTSDLDFDFLLSQVGALASPLTDDSLFTSNLLDENSQTPLTGELSWHVEWFDSSRDIVDGNSCDVPSPNSEAITHDQLRHALSSATNDASSNLNLKQTEATPGSSSQSKVQNGRITEIPKPCSSALSFITQSVPTSTSSTPQDFLSALTPEELQLYSDVFSADSVVASRRPQYRQTLRCLYRHKRSGSRGNNREH